MTVLGLRVPVRTVVHRLYRAFVDTAVGDTAAQLSYYFVFSLFPLLFCLVTLTAYLPLQSSVNELIARASQIMPVEALGLLRDHLNELLHRPQPKLLTGGLFVALWSASRGIDGLRKGLNLAYGVKERRPFWKTQPLAIAMTVGLGLLVLLGFSLMVVGGRIGFLVAEKVHFGEEFLRGYGHLRWPLTTLVISTAMSAAYYFLPDVDQRLKFLWPGALLGTAAWLGATWLFTEYVSDFGRYNVTYGALGGVIILLTWLYISGLIFIMGGVFNAVVEQATVEGKRPGERSGGEGPSPGAVPPGQILPGEAKRAETAIAHEEEMAQEASQEAREEHEARPSAGDDGGGASQPH